MHRATIAVVGLVCATAAEPALGSPASVDSGRAASTSITLRLADGETLSLDILAADLSGGSRLAVYSARCDDAGGCSQADYAAALPAEALTVDPKTADARLDTTLAGRSFVIRWQPGNGAEVGSGHLDGGGASASGSNFAGDAAAVTVEYAGESCTGGGGVGEATVAEVDPTGSGTTTPLDRLHVPDAVTLRC